MKSLPNRFILYWTEGNQFQCIPIKTKDFLPRYALKMSSSNCQPFCPCLTLLTHWRQATHICVGKLTIIGSDNGLSPGRRQAIIWTNDIVNSTLANILQWNCNRNPNIFIQENASEIVVCEMVAILSRPQCVKPRASVFITLVHAWILPS